MIIGKEINLLPRLEQITELQAAVQTGRLTEAQAKEIAVDIGWPEKLLVKLENDAIGKAIRQNQVGGGAHEKEGLTLGHQQRLGSWVPGNPLVGSRGVPRFDEIRADQVVDGIREVVRRARQALDRIEEQPLATWDALVRLPVEVTRGAFEAFYAVQTLLDVKGTDALKGAFREILPEIIELGQELRASRPIYEGMLRLRDSDAWMKLSAAQRHVMARLIQEAENAGVGLVGAERERFNELQLEVREAATRFKDNMLTAIRASGVCDNTENIGRILALRSEMASLLGYDNYADLGFSSKMAANAARVRELLAPIHAGLLRGAKKEAEELAAFGAGKGRNPDGGIHPEDVYFWVDKLEQERCGHDPDEVRAHLPYPHVIEQLFELVGDLFAIGITPAADQSSVWDREACLYEIRDRDGQLMGTFLLDPFERPGEKRNGAWTKAARRCLGPGEGRTVEESAPLAYCCCDLRPPRDGGPAQLSPDEVQTLFHELGHVLQICLNTSTEAAAAPTGGLEWDAVELPSKLMEKWAYDPRVLKRLSSHVETGEPLSDELIDKVIAARSFRLATCRLRTVCRALGDLYLHHDFDPKAGHDPIEAYRHEMVKLGVPDPDAEVALLHEFQHIFAGGYAAGYYAYVWGDMIAADAFAAFQEVGFDNPVELEAVGRRFRDIILAKSGSRGSPELFEEFRGRPPSSDALLDEWRIAGVIES